jgi:hypothetical protein
MISTPIKPLLFLLFSMSPEPNPPISEIEESSKPFHDLLSNSHQIGLNIIRVNSHHTDAILAIQIRNQIIFRFEVQVEITVFGLQFENYCRQFVGKVVGTVFEIGDGIGGEDLRPHFLRDVGEVSPGVDEQFTAFFGVKITVFATAGLSSYKF